MIGSNLARVSSVIRSKGMARMAAARSAADVDDSERFSAAAELGLATTDSTRHPRIATTTLPRESRVVRRLGLGDMRIILLVRLRPPAVFVLRHAKGCGSRSGFEFRPDNRNCPAFLVMQVPLSGGQKCLQSRRDGSWIDLVDDRQFLQNPAALGSVTCASLAKLFAIAIRLNWGALFLVYATGRRLSSRLET